MAEPPAEGLANYPRAGAGQSYAQLKNLADAYNGFSRAFRVNIVFAVGSNVYLRSLGEEVPLGPGIAVLAALVVLVFFVTIGPNRQLGAALGWSPGGPILASVLMALNSALCCGIVGYLVVQEMATKAMRPYGVRKGFFGLKKADLTARLDELARLESGQP